MNELEIAGVVIVVVLVLAAAAYSYIAGPHGPLAARWRKEIHELEVRTRMAQGTELLADLRNMARLYRKVDKRHEAEQALKRALIICKQEQGAKSAMLRDILLEYSQLMLSMQRKREAATFKKQADEIGKK